MKNLFIVVNYNNSQLTINCINSIDHKKFDVKILIIDNNSNKEEKRKLSEIEHVCEVIYLDKNIGYFPGLNEGLIKEELLNYKYVIIGNNDLLFSDDFFEKLLNKKYNDKYYVISPNIVTIDGIHQNPHEIRNISKFRKIMYSIYYKNYYFGQFMYKLQQKLKSLTGKKNRVVDWEISREIFMGYGAIYILTDKFLRHNKRLNYEHFLMGEELFLSWQVYNSGGAIYYDSDLKVTHLEHASVDKLKSRKMYEYSRQSYNKAKSYWNKIDFRKNMKECK